MNRRGNYWDNADELDYIEVFYNRVRRQTHLDGVSPEDLKWPPFGAEICRIGVSPH